MSLFSLKKRSAQLFLHIRITQPITQLLRERQSSKALREALSLSAAETTVYENKGFEKFELVFDPNMSKSFGLWCLKKFQEVSPFDEVDMDAVEDETSLDSTAT